MFPPRLTSLLLTILYTIPPALTAPPPPHPPPSYDTPVLTRRTNNTSTPFPPHITTKILSANGTDISPLFRTLVYRQPSFPPVVPSNLTHHAHHPHHRRQTLPSIRPPWHITHCTSPTATFLGSTCTHTHSGSHASLRDYSVRCRDVYPPPARAHALMAAGYDLSGMPMDQPRYFRERGACGEREICVESLLGESRKRKSGGGGGGGRGGGWLPEVEGEGEVEVEEGPVPVAMCVGWEFFVEDPGFLERVYGDGGAGVGGKGKGKGGEGGEKKGNTKQKLEDKGADAAGKTGVVVSGVDGTMPMELARLEVDVGGGEGRAVQQQTCRECFGMRTQTAARDADFMKIEATLLGAAATAGLVWVTVFAG